MREETGEIREVKSLVGELVAEMRREMLRRADIMRGRRGLSLLIKVPSLITSTRFESHRN